jgi:ferrous iron transport protein B
VLRRAFDGGWLFVRRAGTLILASMVVIWALLYFPNSDAEGRLYTDRIAAIEAEIAIHQAAINLHQDAPPHWKEHVENLRTMHHEVQAEWKAQSVLGRVGKFIEPAVVPLGWDWRIGVAALASFPAREVMVSTLGIIFSQGEGKSDDAAYRDSIGDTMHGIFTVPVAMSVMVFFALCCQCASTLVVIKRETNSWLWPAFTFVYMTVLAYLGALVTFQVGRLFL